METIQTANDLESPMCKYAQNCIIIKHATTSPSNADDTGLLKQACYPMNTLTTDERFGKPVLLLLAFPVRDRLLGRGPSARETWLCGRSGLRTVDATEGGREISLALWRLIGRWSAHTHTHTHTNSNTCMQTCTHTHTQSCIYYK